MNTFGKKIATLRKGKGISQAELAKLLNTSTSVIGRYERDEMTPSIAVAKNIAGLLDTTVGYLLGESEQMDVFKDQKMLQRFQDISQLDEENKKHLIANMDAFLRDAKTRQAYQ